MGVRVEGREAVLREAFGLGAGAELLEPEARGRASSLEPSEHLEYFGMEWHVVPSADAVPFDDAYVSRFYPRAPKDFTHERLHAPSYRDRVAAGHRGHQGQLIAVEATRKPRYLPGNRQFYGTPYGFDATADPFAVYLGRAGMTNATRYAHNYLSLREFLRVVNEDWRARGILPEGYRLTVCPPAVFNLVGTIFHPEWSETETLELGFYRDEGGNATCYAVGSNAPGDYSYMSEVELETDWTLLGFRTALVPE
jgi:hypothetical protein